MDKVLHTLVGALVFSMLSPHVGMSWAFGTVWLVAVGKELWDEAVNRYYEWKLLPAPHTPDVYDALATVAGGWAAMAVTAVLSLLRGYMS